SQDRNRGASKQIPPGKRCRIIERPSEVDGVGSMRSSMNVADGGDKNNDDHRAHSGSHDGVHACRSFDPSNVQQRKNCGKENLPTPYGKSRGELVCLLSAPDRADERIEHVIHYHAPPGDVAPRWIDFLRYV